MATCFCTRTHSCQWSGDLDCSEAQISVNYRQISAAHSQRNVACIRANVVANSQYSLALSSGPAFKHSSRGYVGFGDIVWISSYCSARHARSVSSEINCQTARMSCAVAVKLQNARKLLVHSVRRPPSCNLDPMKFFKLCILSFRMAANWRLLVTYLLLDSVRLCVDQSSWPHSVLPVSVVTIAQISVLCVLQSTPPILQPMTYSATYPVLQFWLRVNYSQTVVLQFSLKIWQKK